MARQTAVAGTYNIGSCFIPTSPTHKPPTVAVLGSKGHKGSSWKSPSRAGTQRPNFLLRDATTKSLFHLPPSGTEDLRPSLHGLLVAFLTHTTAPCRLGWWSGHVLVSFGTPRAQPIRTPLVDPRGTASTWIGRSSLR